MATSPIILCLNSGSSSLKFSLYQLGETETLLATGAIERIGLPGGQLWVHSSDEKVLVETHREFPIYSAAVDMAFEVLEQLHLPQPTAVGHRLVHGGSRSGGTFLGAPKEDYSPSPFWRNAKSLFDG